MELTPASELAAQLGVSTEAVQAARELDFVDMHLEAQIPMRLFGTDVRIRHGMGLLRGRGFGHFDVPRGLDGGLSGAMWSISTNPFRSAAGRWRALLRNLEELRDVVAASAGTMRIARNYAEYERARAKGALACIPSVQGANCLDAALGGPLDVPDQLLVRATLLHLTNSRIGSTSSPWGRFRADRGLSARGHALVERMDEGRVFVDLAHAHPDTFWDAVDAHDVQLPLLVTHTGVQAVCPSWRNLDDDQIRAIAETGGVVGIIYSSYFLVPEGRRDGMDWVLAHLQHVIDVGGEEAAGIGTDHDGFIVPPPGLRSADGHPRLVQKMMDAGWSAGRIQRVLGGNFLAAFRRMRPGPPPGERLPSTL